MSVRSMWRVEGWRRADYPALFYFWDEDEAFTKFKTLEEDRDFYVVRIARRDPDGSIEALRESR